MRALLLGNAAIARGAYEYGVEFASAYPGTPSTEILENMAQYKEIYSEWATNEKVALDGALGAAYAGHRALAAMKHVGVNVASDTLFSSSYSGIKGGLVIVTADDPGMYSSQNEQDNRNYARFAKLPMLEPSDAQECKDFVGLALDLSEEFDTPVFLRTTMRISHGKSLVELGERVAPKQGEEKFTKDPKKYVMIPAHARLRHPVVEERLLKLKEFAETFPHNRIEWGDRRLGIISSGHVYLCAKEVFPQASFLKLGMVYPLPEKLIREFAAGVEKVVVVEELDPFFEERIKLMGINCVGKEVFPITGELRTSTIRECAIKAGLLDEAEATPVVEAEAVPEPFMAMPRPPAFCPGCSHRGLFYVLKKLKLVVFGDIGCYSMGVLPPFTAMDTVTCMGASVGLAHGAQRVGITDRSVAVIGDSTFFHAGVAPLINVIYNGGATVTIILDNGSTAMTGAQQNPGTGVNLRGEPTRKVDIEQLVRGLGVEKVWTVNALDVEQIEETVEAALAVEDEPSVVIVRGDCVFVHLPERSLLTVDTEACTACGICFRVGCPAILKDYEHLFRGKRPKAEIDLALCNGCDICRQVCPLDAILPV
ncbi:MAG: indolepyruvate ferredoxin oxidoreductase subunit alpha [Anaerolineae bacterium]